MLKLRPGTRQRVPGRLALFFLDELQGPVRQFGIALNRVADVVESLRCPTALRDLGEALRLSPALDLASLLLRLCQVQLRLELVGGVEQVGVDRRKRLELGV